MRSKNKNKKIEAKIEFFLIEKYKNFYINFIAITRILVPKKILIF